MLRSLQIQKTDSLKSVKSMAGASAKLLVFSVSHIKKRIWKTNLVLVWGSVSDSQFLFWEFSQESETRLVCSSGIVKYVNFYGPIKLHLHLCRKPVGFIWTGRQHFPQCFFDPQKSLLKPPCSPPDPLGDSFCCWERWWLAACTSFVKISVALEVSEDCSLLSALFCPEQPETVQGYQSAFYVTWPLWGPGGLGRWRLTALPGLKDLLLVFVLIC